MVKSLIVNSIESHIIEMNFYSHNYDILKKDMLK